MVNYLALAVETNYRVRYSFGLSRLDFPLVPEKPHPRQSLPVVNLTRAQNPEQAGLPRTAFPEQNDSDIQVDSILDALPDNYLSHLSFESG